MDKKIIAKIVESMNDTIHDIATTDDQKIKTLKELSVELFAELDKE